MTSAEKLAQKEWRDCINVHVKVEIVSSAALELQSIQRQWPSPQNKYRKAILNWGRRGTGFRNFFLPPVIPALSRYSAAQAPAFAKWCHWGSSECTADSVLRSRRTPPRPSRLSQPRPMLWPCWVPEGALELLCPGHRNVWPGQDRLSLDGWRQGLLSLVLLLEKGFGFYWSRICVICSWEMEPMSCSWLVLSEKGKLCCVKDCFWVVCKPLGPFFFSLQKTD